MSVVYHYVTRIGVRTLQKKDPMLYTIKLSPSFDSRAVGSLLYNTILKYFRNQLLEYFKIFEQLVPFHITPSNYEKILEQNQQNYYNRV